MNIINKLPYEVVESKICSFLDSKSLVSMSKMNRYYNFMLEKEIIKRKKISFIYTQKEYCDRYNLFKKRNILKRARHIATLKTVLRNFNLNYNNNLGLSELIFSNLKKRKW